MKWSTIKVPEIIKQKIAFQAKLEEVPMHVIVEKAFNVYMAQMRDVGGQPFLKGKRHSRGMWYAWRLMLSYAEYRIAIKNDLEDLKRYRESFLRNIRLLRERMKIVTPEEQEKILQFMDLYEKTKLNKYLFPLNDIVRDIFFRCLK
ncbi:MAG: hypothetical protein DRO13_04875 [Thermoprotei archaeon]|nr:MAG: hypothetical protein DRO13_04875 [Thermoprotei archaeon]